MKILMGLAATTMSLFLLTPTLSQAQVPVAANSAVSAPVAGACAARIEHSAQV